MKLKIRQIVILVTGMMLAGSLAFASEYKHKKKSRARVSDEEIRALETIMLGFEIKDGDIYFSWNPATSESSGGVKIVYSSSHSQPLYPHDRYAKWIPGSSHSSSVIPNKKAASKEPRYYRVCSVKPRNHHEYVALSNVVKVPAIEQTEKSKKQWQKTIAEKHRAKQSIICPSCGWKGSADFKFCAKCGSKLEKKKPATVCPSCGWKGKKGYSFCAKCGTEMVRK